ncbi:MAG: hypothetical protein VYC11_03210 [Candidatus Thermoplasmatota archaeon]|nr:hypothetical protein [Candidatus Thermoplasmatota archaeon]MEE2747332.1 hypothetical protein [Candidatus Thermoplasmatota archaeon]
MRLSRKSRKFQRRINRSRTIESLQTIANEVQVEYDSREITHNEAITLGNKIQLRASSIDNSQLVYAISDRDTYRRLIEVYLDDGILTRTEQILLWDERRKLGISDEAHESLLTSLVARYQRQGRPIHIQSMPKSPRPVEEDEQGE